MPKIGIVLSGCAGKGAYEVGCLQAIVEYFGIENIKCISAASMGAFVAQSYGMTGMEGLNKAFGEMDSGKYGKYILGFATCKEAEPIMKELFCRENNLPYEHYVAIWNLSRSRAEYIPFHELPQEELLPYMLGALSVPLFSKGVVIKGDRIFDGAFVDNIPMSPLLDKDLDFVFCVYFDNAKYVFESDEFNRKIIKLYDFPNKDRLKLLLYEPGSYERMRSYGYDYAMGEIKKLFDGREMDEIYEAISKHEFKDSSFRPRLTADVVLNNINVMTKRYFKSGITRERKKKK